MTVKSHITLSMLPVALLYKNNIIHYQHLDFVAVAFIGTFIGAILPDIDEPNSYIGRKLPFVSELLKAIGIKHRTYTHSIFFPLIIAAFGFLHPIFFFIGFGAFMHILEDFITNTGAPLFYPFYKKRVGIRLFDTGSVFEFLFTGVVTILSLAFFFQNFNFLNFL